MEEQKPYGLEACESERVDHISKFPRLHSRFPRQQSVAKTTLK